jgi:SulP family sulfate permease
VVLSLLLQLNQAALDLKVVELVPRDDGRLEERAAPRRAASHSVILLDVYGTLHYAGARTLQHHLPDPTGTQAPAVVLRMRGRSTLGATFFAGLAGYARQLADVGGRLYVSGLDPALVAQAERIGSIPDDGPVRLHEASPVVGTSRLQAFHDAQVWTKAPQVGEPDA